MDSKGKRQIVGWVLSINKKKTLTLQKQAHVYITHTQASACINVKP